MPEQHMETREDLLTRFELVEMMMQEGRRSTEYWGWSFVLWGAAYLVAIAWSYWSHASNIAWPVTMIAATVLSVVVATTLIGMIGFGFYLMYREQRDRRAQVEHA